MAEFGTVCFCSPTSIRFTKYNFYLIKLSVFQTCAHFFVLFLPDGSIFEEISTDDLLLPTLDVFVLEEGLDKQIIPFRSTHPQVNLHCSKRRSQDGRFIEVLRGLILVPVCE